MNEVVVVELVTKSEDMCVHISSTFDKAFEWIRKHGKNWDFEEYYFISYTSEVDNDDFCEDITDSIYVDMNGEKISKPPFVK